MKWKGSGAFFRSRFKGFPSFFSGAERGRAVFRDETVYLSDLTNEDARIERCDFTGCLLVGPAVLMPSEHLDLIHNEIGGCAEAVLWEIDIDERPRVIGAIEIVDCSFRGCTFRHVGFAGSTRTIETLRASLGIEEGGK